MSLVKTVRALGEAIQRYWTPKYTVALDTAGPPVNATAIPYGRFSGGRVIVADTIASTTLTFWESDTENGTYVPCYSGGAQVTATLPGGVAASCEIPDGVSACAFLKIQSSADDAETVTIIRKS